MELIGVIDTLKHGVCDSLIPISLLNLAFNLIYMYLNYMNKYTNIINDVIFS